MPSISPLILLLVHLARPALGSGFLSSAVASASSAMVSLEGVASKAAIATEKASEEAAEAVADRAKTAAGEVSVAVSDASTKAALAAADTALQHSGKCTVLHQNAGRVDPTISPLIAQGMQQSAADPSADAATCRKIVLQVTQEEISKAWQDATGLSDQIVAGLSGTVLPYVCGPTLLQSLKLAEGIRKSFPDAYKASIQQTLKESVFTDAWIRETIAAHCGEEPIVQLFADSSLGHLLTSSDRTVRSTLASIACLSAAGLSVALLSCAQRRFGAWAPALLDDELYTDAIE